MDDLARSVDPSNKTRELQNEITRIKTEIQASDSRERLRLLANELNKALCGEWTIWRENSTICTVLFHCSFSSERKFR